MMFTVQPCQYLLYFLPPHSNKESSLHTASNNSLEDYTEHTVVAMTMTTFAMTSKLRYHLHLVLTFNPSPKGLL